MDFLWRTVASYFGRVVNPVTLSILGAPKTACSSDQFVMYGSVRVCRVYVDVVFVGNVSCMVVCGYTPDNDRLVYNDSLVWCVTMLVWCILIAYCGV